MITESEKLRRWHIVDKIKEFTSFLRETEFTKDDIPILLKALDMCQSDIKILVKNLETKK